MFNPSKYQVNVFEFTTNGTGNAVINAVAGSGKTTTLVETLKLIPPNKITYFLAFNKSIVEELSTRVPKGINVSTLHSVGCKSLMKAYKGSLNDKKCYAIIDNYKRAWLNEDNGMQDSEYSGRVKKLVDLYRINLVTTEDELQELAKKHSVETINGECKRAMIVVEAMMMNKREFDFVDMLYIPAVDDSIMLPKADFIFIDECQDLNKAQQALFKKMMKPTTRFIAVGDPRQAIYGFAGADVESFNNLKSTPNTIELPLSINYRCGKKIIELAQRIVPQLEAAPNAIEGEVKQEASYKDIQDGDMVLCRNTAPLVKLCLEFIRDGKKAYVKGGDIGKSMINLIRQSKATTLDQFDEWISNQLANVYSRLCKKYPYVPEGDIENEPAYAILKDKRLVLETIVDTQNLKTPEELIKWIETLFGDNKLGVCFSTVHKAKGLESKNVYIIERDLMPAKWARKPWQQDQERNLEYVAYTRAKELLGFVSDWSFKKDVKKPELVK